MITCVIPVFNETKERIKRTVQSVIDSNIPRILIVDDASDEPVVFANNRVGVIRLDENVGPAAATNAGIEESRDDYIAILDCGDTFFEEKWGQVLWSMENGHAATFSRCVDELTGEIRPLADDWEKRMFMDNQFQSSTTVINRTKTGLLDPSYRWGSDNEFHSRVHAKVGWRLYDIVTGTATAWPDGHTSRGTGTKERRDCQRRIMKAMKKYSREVCRV